MTQLRNDFAPGVITGSEVQEVFALAKAEGFAKAVRRYLPEVEAGWLSPDYAGVRPKLAGPGEAFRDFVVAEESEVGLPGFVSCIGIESPGLTASPAIADRVVDLLRSL